MRLWPFARRDSTLENPSADLVSALIADMDGPSVAGINMTPKTALRLSAVNACVRVLAESVASLPLPVYRRDGRSREKVPADPRWALLNDAPNQEMYAMEFHETLLANAILWGRGYAYIVRDGAGMPVELWPLRPDRTSAHRSRSTNSPYYVTTLDSGEPKPLAAEDVIDLKSIYGMSPVRTAKPGLSGAAAAEDYATNMWANQSRPGGIIEVDQPFADEDAYQDFRRRWNAGHQGLSKSQLVGILTGAKWRDVGIPPKDAQFLESRQFGVREICRLFRVPPHMIADLDGTVTRASIEQQAIEFVVYSLRPWLIRSEQAYKMRLFSRPEDRELQLYPEWLVEGLLRGDTAVRYEAYAKAIQFGWMSRAEPRELENLPYVEGLDHFLVPVNMTTAEKILEMPPPTQGEQLQAASLAALSLLMRGQSGSDALVDLATKVAAGDAKRNGK